MSEIMKCKICGEEETPSRYYGGEKLIEHQMCFSCNFWRDMLERDAQREPHTWCMIDGTHYVIAPEDDPETYFRGFAGQKFQIEFNDGYKVVTTNLWCQGEPSKYWKDKFPNNARFENNLKWVKIGNNEYLFEK